MEQPDDQNSGFTFTIHYLQDTFKKLPVKSVPFRPNYFSFLFVKDAFGNYTIDDKLFEVAPLTVYFTNPGNYRMFETYKVVDMCLITFDEPFLKEYVHADVYTHFAFLLTETVAPRTLSTEQFTMIEKIYRLIHEHHFSRSPYKTQIVGSLIVTLLLKIKEYFFQDYNPINEGNRSSQIVKTFKQNLESHFRELAEGKVKLQLRVQDFADMQSLHSNYLSRVIASKTGKSISNWIAERLVIEAKVLLQDQHLSVKEVSGRLGFSEAPHFSNHFKKHTGLSPVQYRKEYFDK
ncbi:helix-turn-helix domain-containing protein [Marinoscillum luteum]|uniref:Helix-turn-helix domain-containing protein n=2 Tax=Marinoscillum luteum TaxID=861051 RepID=A0ABW7N7U6_9BACT